MMSGEHGNEVVVDRTDDLELPEGTQTVLVSVDPPPTDRVCHLVGEDARSTLCLSTGTFRPISSSEARSHVDRVCENCRTQYKGGQRRRPCPLCEESIAANQWPIHIRNCDHSG